MGTVSSCHYSISGIALPSGMAMCQCPDDDISFVPYPLWFCVPSVSFTRRQSHPSLLTDVEVPVAPLRSSSLKSPERPPFLDTTNQSSKSNFPDSHEIMQPSLKQSLW